jgi:hypothetical protein
MTSNTDSGMVERVARALHEALAGDDADEMIHHPAQKSWEEPSWPKWQQWEDAASAAIAATLAGLRNLDRETIQAMETAVEDSIDSTSDSYCTYDVWDANTIANAVHRAMLSALTPKGAGGEG